MLDFLDFYVFLNPKVVPLRCLNLYVSPFQLFLLYSLNGCTRPILLMLFLKELAPLSFMISVCSHYLIAMNVVITADTFIHTLVLGQFALVLNLLNHLSAVFQLFLVRQYVLHNRRKPLLLFFEGTWTQTKIVEVQVVVVYIVLLVRLWNILTDFGLLELYFES